MKKVRIGKNQMRPPRVKLLTLSPGDLAVVHRQGARGLSGQDAEGDCNQEHRAWLQHLKTRQSLGAISCREYLSNMTVVCDKNPLN